MMLSSILQTTVGPTQEPHSVLCTSLRPDADFLLLPSHFELVPLFFSEMCLEGHSFFCCVPNILQQLNVSIVKNLLFQVCMLLRLSLSSYLV